MQQIEERLNDFQLKISENHNRYSYIIINFRVIQLGIQIDQAAKENFKSQIASLKLSQGKVLKSIEQLNQEKADREEVNDNIDNLFSILSSHEKSLVENKNQSITVENYVEKYLPIKIQTQISETLKEVADKKTK